jgi:hypothetical protein
MSENFFSNLAPETIALVDKLLAEPLRTSADLREEVNAYQARIEDAGENADVELGLCIATSCNGLLDLLDQDVPESQHRFIQLACRYFVEEEDEDGDLESMLGFDDDAEVLNLVADQLGHPELRVQGLPGLKS